MDLMKAYNSVRWNFLLAILQMIGFPSRMVNWIGECISTTKFSVSINGELQGFFDGSRGLRQGGLSPYLFVLVIEVLLGFLGQMDILISGFICIVRGRKLLIYVSLMI